jgi:RND family efflux transporter MFP subunit
MRSISPGWVVIQGPLMAIAVASLAGCGPRADPKAEPKPPTVTVVAVRKSNAPQVVHSQGTPRALNDVTVRARVKGFLQKADFTEGKNVKAGQLLLVIDEEPYQAKLDQARAKLDEALADQRKAEQSKAREVAEAQLHLAEAQRTLDQVEERRERSLLARNAATIDDVDRRVATLRKSSAQVEADLASLEQARADYETNILAAKSKVEAARADVRDAEINLGYCRMYAPIDGRIGQSLVKPGNLVGKDQNTDLVSIQQLDPIGVDLNPPARRLPEITRLLKKGKVLIDLLIEGERQYPEKAEVYFLDNTVDSTAGTVLMKAKVPNPEESLLPGQYVRITGRLEDFDDVIVVPDQAVIEGQGGPSVYVVEEGKDGKNVEVVAVKTIDTIDTDQGIRVIRSGLQPGQKVIVDGIQLVRPGQTLEVEEKDLDQVIQEAIRAGETDRYESPAPARRSSDGGNPSAAAKKTASDLAELD